VHGRSKTIRRRIRFRRRFSPGIRADYLFVRFVFGMGENLAFSVVPAPLDCRYRHRLSRSLNVTIHTYSPLPYTYYYTVSARLSPHHSSLQRKRKSTDDSHIAHYAKPYWVRSTMTSVCRRFVRRSILDVVRITRSVICRRVFVTLSPMSVILACSVDRGYLPSTAFLK